MNKREEHEEKKNEMTIDNDDKSHIYLWSSLRTKRCLSVCLFVFVIHLRRTTKESISIQVYNKRRSKDRYR